MAYDNMMSMALVAERWTEFCRSVGADYTVREKVAAACLRDLGDERILDQNLCNVTILTFSLHSHLDTSLESDKTLSWTCVYSQ